MKIRIFMLFVLSMLLFLTACNNQTNSPNEADIYDLILNRQPLFSEPPNYTTVHASSEISITIAHVTDELLAQYSDFIEFSYRGRNPQTDGIAFISNVAVRNFRYIRINGAEIEFIVEEDLFILDELSPNVPFLVDWAAMGSMAYGGFAFDDEDGVTRYFGFNYDARGYTAFRIREFMTNSTTMRIHEDMPEFIFKRILGDFVDTCNIDMTHEERYITIMVLDENGELLQVIDGIIQGGHGDWIVSEHHFFELRFDDFNFDGYLDMWLLSAVNPGTAGGAWGHFWLWDNDYRQFVKSEELSHISEMAWLSANHETRQIEVSSRGGGAGPWATQYYEWIDGELAIVYSVLIENVWRKVVPSYQVITRRNHLTGETTREFDPPENAPAHSITKIVEINPYMEFPTHEVRLDMWRLPEDSQYRVGGYQYEIEIMITGMRRYNSGVFQSWQTIGGLRAGYGYGRWIEIDPENPLNLHFADFNGNGYLDMALRRFPPQTGNMADDTHYFWLFNPEAYSLWNAFERNHSLEHAASLGQIMSVGDGLIEIFSFHGLMSQYLVTYVYVDGEFVFVNSENVSPSIDQE